MAEPRKLSPDVIALIHHIELSEAGWLNHATARAVKFTLWLLGGTATADEITKNQDHAGIDHLTLASASAVMATLAEEGSLIEIRPGQYRLSEIENTSITESVDKAQETEIFVKNKITKSAIDSIGNDTDIDAEKLWITFHRDFIVPFVTEFGARVYELVTGNHPDISQVGYLNEFLSRFPKNTRTTITKMALSLLDRKSPECRKYILRSVNAYFYRSASHLPTEIINRVFGGKNKNKRIRLILDTNFLFSLLDLHDNPSNEAVSLLINTISKLPDGMQVGLYVLPATINEFRHALSGYEFTASQIRVTEKISDAAEDAQLPGVIKTFIKRSKKSGYKITPKEYFSPFHDNITEILKKKNVEILQESEDEHTKDQRIIDDTVDQLAFYKNKYINNPSKQKRYEQIWHDVCLWYTVKDRRRGVIDTIFDADWMGVTIDYSMIAFDEFKRKNRGIPCLIHPAVLVQTLQFLVPSDENLEETLFALMQLPFLFDGIDPEAERASVKILSAISRYEDIDDISVDSIAEILSDRALRSKITDAKTQDHEFTLVRDALIKHYKEIEEKHAQSVKENIEKSEKINELTENIENIGNAAREKAAENDALNEKLSNMEEKIYKNNAVTGLLFSFVFIIISSLFVYGFFIKIILEKTGYHGLIASSIIIISISTKIAKTFFERNSIPKNWKIYTLIHAIDRVFWWVIAVSTAAILSDYAQNSYNAIKTTLS